MHKARLFDRKGKWFWEITYQGKVVARCRAKGYGKKGTAKRAFENLCRTLRLGALKLSVG